MRHVILGNGPAGVVAAEMLRKLCAKDEIVMVGCEDAPPYSRMAIPYLLVGNIDESGTYLRKTPKHFENLNIVQKHGLVKQVDAKAAALGLSNEDATKLLLGEKEPSMQFTTPEELGELAVFFCSTAGNNVRGVAWNMDGGWTAQ